MRPHGKARVDSTSPSAWGTCDRCASIYLHRDLHWQLDYRGRSLQNLRILVCDRCIDDPQPQLKPRILTVDPVPIQNARPFPYVKSETDYRYTEGNTVHPVLGIPVIGGDVRVTQANDKRVTQQTGAPNGSLNNEPGSNSVVPGNDDIGLPYDNTSVPKSGA